MSSSSDSIALVILNGFCVLLPIIAFVSPFTVFSPIFCNCSRAAAASSPNNDDGHTCGNKIQMPPLAVTSQMLQCGLFAIYAQYLRSNTLLIPNVIGFLLGLVWSTLYRWGMASSFASQWRWQYFLSMAMLVAGAVSAFKFRNPYYSSSVAAVSSVVMCTYPLPVIKRAWESREAALLGSTFMNLAMFLCCISWTIHSSPYVEYDIFVLTGNVCGVVVQGAALWTRLYLHHLQEEPTIPESNEQSPLLIA